MSKEFQANVITDAVKFGERLRRIRALKEMTQIEMASRIGLTTASYSNWELGKRKPRINKIKRVADILGVPVGYLLSEEDVDLSKSIEEQIASNKNDLLLPFVTGVNFNDKDSENQIFAEARRYRFQLLNRKEENDLFLFKVEGSSMETTGKRTLPPGTIAVCTRKFNLMDARGMPVVVSVKKGSAIIREWDLDGNDVRLIPWNQNYAVNKYPQTDIKIYGLVLKCILNFE